MGKAHKVKIKISHKDAKVEESYTDINKKNSHRKVKKKKITQTRGKETVHRCEKGDTTNNMWKMRNQTKM